MKFLLFYNEEKLAYSQIDASKVAAQVSTQAHLIWHFLDNTRHCVFTTCLKCSTQAALLYQIIIHATVFVFRSQEVFISW